MLVEAETARVVEGGRGVVVALAGGFVGNARVVLFQSLHCEVHSADVHGWGAGLAPDRQAHAVDGQGVRHGGGFQVNVEAAVQAGRGFAAD